VALLACGGCGLTYIAHVTNGQSRILVGRISIESRLDDAAVTSREKSKLRLVLDVKRFAHESFGLADSGSYSTVYDTEGDAVAWNLSACAEDSFTPYTWTFPILGSMPYKGYFTRAKATSDFEELRAQGMDVLLWPVSAYSTLGWFSDPLFTPMLEYSDVHLANTIFHELAHATVFIERDADFNETLATFVGGQGAIEFFEARGGKQDPRLLAAADEDHDDRVFSQEIARLEKDLTDLYASAATKAEKLSGKKRLIDDFKVSFRSKIRPKLKTRRYDYIPSEDLNNAWILAHARYHGDIELFMKLHVRLGSHLRATVEKLKEIAKSDDPRAALVALTRD
jgi:predicted aminopeptidase